MRELLCLVEDSVDLGRMKGSVSATYGVTDVCTTTIAVGLFQVLVKQGKKTSSIYITIFIQYCIQFSLYNHCFCLQYLDHLEGCPFPYECE
jgi:hypothetical protein